VSEVDSQDLFYYVIKILRHKANEKKHSSEKRSYYYRFYTNQLSLNRKTNSCNCVSLMLSMYRRFIAE